MHTIKDVLQMITKGCYMTSIDLKDAYHSVKIDPRYQCYLKFNFENSLFQYVCYPNRLGPCPRRFTKITSVPMSVIRKQGHPICRYIDDFILVKLSFEASMQATLSTAELFMTLGFVVHPEKSQLIPSHKITFLGFVIYSVNMTITVTEKRFQTFKTLLNIILKIKRPTIRFVAKVTGHIISILPASKYGALYYRKLENDKILALHKNAGNFEANMSISSEGFQDLIWWSENMTLPNASDFAWGECIMMIKK